MILLLIVTFYKLKTSRLQRVGNKCTLIFFAVTDTSGHRCVTQKEQEK